MQSLIEKHKVLVCCGSGGVGKTTLSSCIGVLAAQQGRRVLVLTIDPAKRLATALGLSSNDGLPVKVPGQNFSGELYAAMIDPEKIFAEFIRNQAESPEQAERLLNNRLYKQLSTTFSGSQEFTSLEMLARVVESNEYDLVVLDTPPAQHAIDFLNSPQKLYSLFQEKITKWFVSDSKNQGFIQKIVHKGTQSVFKALEKLTGAEFIGELSDFFASIHSVQGAVSQRSLDVHKLLTGADTGFILVTGFDEGKLKEAEYFRKELMKAGYGMAGLIVNRAFPTWLSDESELLEKHFNSLDWQEILRLYELFSNYHQGRLKSYDEFVSRFDQSLPITRIPDMNKDIYGLEAIELLSRELSGRWNKA